MTDWQNRCVLCAGRGREVKLERGHCCPACAERITYDIRSLPELAALASTSPSAGKGGFSTVYGPRIPIVLDAVDPELGLVELLPGDPTSAVTILECVESWERLIRDERQMAPYGPVSALRTAEQGSSTYATLVGVCAFLATQVDYATSEPTFSLEEFAAEMRRCAQVLRRWDLDAKSLGTMVKCPTVSDDGACGYRLYYQTFDEQVTCRRCRVTRDASTLVAVAMSDGRDVWLDPEAASTYLGIAERTLRQMAQRGDIRRLHGRYLIRHADVAAC